MFKKVVLLSGDLHQLGATAYGKARLHTPSERDRKAVKGNQRRKTCHFRNELLLPASAISYGVPRLAGKWCAGRLPSRNTDSQDPRSSRVECVGRLLVGMVLVVTRQRMYACCPHILSGLLPFLQFGALLEVPVRVQRRGSIK